MTTQRDSEQSERCPSCNSSRKDSFGYIPSQEFGRMQCRDPWHSAPAAQPEPTNLGTCDRRKDAHIEVIGCVNFRPLSVPAPAASQPDAGMEERAREFLEADGCENPKLYSHVLADFARQARNRAVQECHALADSRLPGAVIRKAIRDAFPDAFKEDIRENTVID